ncbi:MAG: winged helix-turn-helix transcriptional regulator, partial [Actinomycetota bacterium]
TEDVIVTTDAETLAQWNLRRITFEEALRSGRCRVEGPAGLVKAFPTWVRPSPFADISPAR